jgi:hypothetical protein
MNSTPYFHPLDRRDGLDVDAQANKSSHTPPNLTPLSQFGEWASAWIFQGIYVSLDTEFIYIANNSLTKEIVNYYSDTFIQWLAKCMFIYFPL